MLLKYSYIDDVEIERNFQDRIANIIAKEYPEFKEQAYYYSSRDYDNFEQYGKNLPIGFVLMHQRLRGRKDFVCWNCDKVLGDNQIKYEGAFWNIIHLCIPCYLKLLQESGVDKLTYRRIYNLIKIFYPNEKIFNEKKDLS